MKFISYDGDWPNLCRGTLVVEKDSNQYSIYGALISGGWCGFDPDGEDQFVAVVLIVALIPVAIIQWMGLIVAIIERFKE